MDSLKGGKRKKKSTAGKSRSKNDRKRTRKYCPYEDVTESASKTVVGQRRAIKNGLCIKSKNKRTKLIPKEIVQSKNGKYVSAKKQKNAKKNTAFKEYTKKKEQARKSGLDSFDYNGATYVFINDICAKKVRTVKENEKWRKNKMNKGQFQTSLNIAYMNGSEVFEWNGNYYKLSKNKKTGKLMPIGAKRITKTEYDRA